MLNVLVTTIPRFVSVSISPSSSVGVLDVPEKVHVTVHSSSGKRKRSSLSALILMLALRLAVGL